MTPKIEAPASTQGYSEIFNKIDRMTGLERKQFAKGMKPEEKKGYVEHCRSRDTEKVTGIFRCFEPVGGSLKMTAAAYPGEDPVTYEFLDGQEYTIPKYIARRLENEFQGSGTWYPTHSYIMDTQGKPIPGIGKKNRRFGFSSMDFM